MYKYELANMAGCSVKTLRRWMKQPKHRQFLESIGVRPTDHQLPPRAVQYIMDEYAIVRDGC